MAEKNNIFCKIFLKLGNNKKNGMDEGGEEESTSEKREIGRRPAMARNWRRTAAALAMLLQMLLIEMLPMFLAKLMLILGSNNLADCLRCLLTPSAVLEENTAIDGTIFRANSLLSSSTTGSSGSCRSGLTVCSWRSIWSGFSFWSWWTWWTIGAGWSRWAGWASST